MNSWEDGLGRICPYVSAELDMIPHGESAGGGRGRGIQPARGSYPL